MSEELPKESDSQKRPHIEVDSPLFTVCVIGSEGEKVKDIEEIFERQLQNSAERIEELSKEVEDKTFI